MEAQRLDYEFQQKIKAMEQRIAGVASAAEAALRTKAVRRLADEKESISKASLASQNLESSKRVIRKLLSSSAVGLIPVWPLRELSVANQLMLVLTAVLCSVAWFQSRQALSQVKRQRPNGLLVETHKLQISKPGNDSLRLRSTSVVSPQGGFSSRLASGVSPALSAESGGMTPRSPHMEL